MEATKKQPKVSVCVVTYNQDKYIRQCLQSIVDQVTDFPFEVIVGDDYSTDGTRFIVDEFTRNYPELVRPIFRSENVGPYINAISTHDEAVGEYIAHVDGDDFCLPGKLQAQADILDQYSECNFVWHPVLVELPNGEISKKSYPNIKNIGEIKFYRKDIIQYISIGVNSSKMYRATVRKFPLPDFELVDYLANVEQAGDGYARFVDNKPYGVYRLGIGIASSSLKTRYILSKCFVRIKDRFPEYTREVNTASLMYLVADLKNFRKSWFVFAKAWAKTFHWQSIFKLISSYKIIKNMTFKN